MTPQQQARRQARVEALAAASIRALSGVRDAAFRGRRLHRGGQRLPRFAPHLHPGLDEGEASLRGAADGLALRLLHSDPALHVREAPAGRIERLLFDWLEQLRVESLAGAAWPGVARNLRQRHDDWSLAFHRAGHTGGASGLLLYTAAQMARARLCGGSAIDETVDLMEAPRFALAPKIGRSLAALRRTRADQAAFAVPAREIVATVAAMLRSLGGSGDALDADAAARDAADETLSRFGFLLEGDEPVAVGEPSAVVAAGGGRSVVAKADRYRVYTGAYDREAAATDGARPALLDELRRTLDLRLAATGIDVVRLSAELMAVFAVPVVDGWRGGEEDGQVDGRALAGLIASPSNRRVFRREREAPRADAAVTFLLDCSGSMKAHAADVAVLVDLHVRALERAGIACEVLGFSTSAWNGGRARRDWERAGRPASPGRIAERLHLVFKPHRLRWRQAKAGLAALLRPELFREGLDGEAVEWAAARLAARDEARRALVVVSDGSPMESATALGNGAGDGSYLDRHLLDVAGRIERAGAIELMALGVGLDLGPWFRRSRVLDLAAGVDRRALRDMQALLAGRTLPIDSRRLETT